MAIVQNNEVSVSNSGTRGKVAVRTVFFGTSLIIGLILFRWTGFPGQRSV